MTKKASKAIVVGIDAPIVPRLHRYCREGHLPTIKRLFVDGGVWAGNCLVPLPTVTPPNWAAISTGAWPSTVHITDFNVHVPGEPLNKTRQGMFSEDVQAETLYEALARVEKKSILLNYPSTWPPKVEDSIVVGGNSLSINGWSQRVPLDMRILPGGGQVAAGEPTGLNTYSGPGLYATEELPGGTVLQFQAPNGWKDISGSSEGMAAEMPLKFTSCLYKMSPVTWHILVRDGKAKVCESRDADTSMATLTEGEWSPVIAREFQTERGMKKALFRMKLLALSPDTTRFRLLVTSIAAADGWSHPESIATEITSAEGLPGPGSPWGGYARKWYDLDTVVELEHMENAFFGDAAAYLLSNKPWDFYMMHAHAPDSMYHAISNQLDNPDPDKRRPFEEAELAMYQSIDEMCAKIFGCADENTIMAMVSDHGAKPTTGIFGPNFVLRQGGCSRGMRIATSIGPRPRPTLRRPPTST